MKSFDEDTLPLKLIGGVVQAQVLHVPPEIVMNIPSYRHACRLAWRVARLRRKITKRTLAELAGLYPSHVTEYFSAHPKPKSRDLPAAKIAVVESILGNTIISQYQAQQSKLTVLEEMQAQRRSSA
jgi:hypothetical protein